jgi:hypothetical protein
VTVGDLPKKVSACFAGSSVTDRTTVYGHEAGASADESHAAQLKKIEA